MFRDLIPALDERFHVVASDVPRFSFSDVPDRKHFRYTFDNLANTIDSFSEAIGVDR